MPPLIPSVSLPVWSDLYDAAVEFHELRPWEMLGDLDLVGVRDPSGNETGYAAVMGSGGTLFGLCLYRGAEGFDIYRRLVSGESDPYTEDIFAIQNCLKFELASKRDLEPEDLAVVRKLGRSFTGPPAWPQFRSLLPGYVPWFFTEAEAKFMTFALKAVCRHTVKIAQGELTQSLRSDECLVYSPKAGAKEEFEFRWELVPVLKPMPYPPPMLNITRINAIRAKQLQPDSPWEVDVFYLPSSIFEGGRPYFLRMVVACQQSSGFAFAFDVLQPDVRPAQALADVICSSIEEHGLLPGVILVRNEELAIALRPLGKALGVGIRAEEQLEAIQFLKEEMENQLQNGRRVPRPSRVPKSSPKAKTSRRAIYRIKVSLKGSEPRIWRRFLVPADYTLNKLHRVLQVVMGWEDYHLYEFKVGGVSYGRPDPEFGEQMKNDKSVRMQEIADPGSSFTYVYDFGDGWQHELKIENTLVAEEGQHYPRCTEGKGACPPEDCGGIGGFGMLLEAIRHPATQEQRDLATWAGDFDPDLFDIDAINKRLRKIK